MTDWLISGAGMIFFWLALLLSLLVIPAGLPGTFMITALALLHGWATSFDPISGTFVFTLLGIAVAGEVCRSSRRYGPAAGVGNIDWRLPRCFCRRHAGGVTGRRFPRRCAEGRVRRYARHHWRQAEQGDSRDHHDRHDLVSNCLTCVKQHFTTILSQNPSPVHNRAWPHRFFAAGSRETEELSAQWRVPVCR